ATALMLVCYALEDRSPWYVLGFAVACVLAGLYAFLQGAWPLGLVEIVFTIVGAGSCVLSPRERHSLGHSGRRTRELTQHVVQEAAVAEIVALVECIGRRAQGDRSLLAARISDVGLEPLHRLDIGKPAQAHGLVALEVERPPRRAFAKHEWKHTHANQVR